MRERITAADIDWSALDAAATTLDDATADAARAISAAADARAAEVERLNREGVPLALIARHLGISRQAIDSLLTSYRKRKRDRDHD